MDGTVAACGDKNVRAAEQAREICEKSPQLTKCDPLHVRFRTKTDCKEQESPDATARALRLVNRAVPDLGREPVPRVTLVYRSCAWSHGEQGHGRSFFRSARKFTRTLL
ncbi:hypothetical protein GCM10022630_32710 [Thermobifida alba]